MTKREKADIIVDVMVWKIRSNTSTHPDPARIIQEIWSEGFTLAERGDERIWCNFILDTERSGKPEFWYRRIKSAVLKRIKETR